MHGVDLSPLWALLNQFISLILQGLAIAAVGWITYVIQKYAPTFMKGWLETKASNDLNMALQNGTAAAMNKLGAWESVHSNVAVKGMVTAWAAQYAVNHAPDAVAKFGLSPDQLAVKALAYIPAPSLLVDGAPQIKTEHVDQGNLPDIK